MIYLCHFLPQLYNINGLLQGALLGLTLSFLIGPLFFSIIQAGIERGFQAGLAVALGIWISDFAYVLVMSSSIQILQQTPGIRQHIIWMGWVGSVLLIFFGIGTILAQKKIIEVSTTKPYRSLFGYAFRGFAINTVNPFTVFFWIGIAATISTYSVREIWLFFGGMFGVLIAADIFKACAAHWLRDHLSPRLIQIVQYCIGVFLIVSGVILAIKV